MPGNPWRYFHHARARSSGDGGFETIGLGRDVVDPLVGLWGLALSPRGEGSASIGAAFAEAEVVALARRMTAEDPAIGALVLECTNLPPYAEAVQKAVGLPVYDIFTLIRHLHSALARRSFAA
ncbi:MAG: hypothetical protein EHM15_12110 [Desulfobacteraceae bacterium]|nr:MAG: hypothetical protein EHM15_12110 [Desulfobacteraceae bacterium]